MSRSRHFALSSALILITLAVLALHLDTGRPSLAQDQPTHTPNVHWVAVPAGVVVRSSPVIEADNVLGVLPLEAWVQPLARTRDGVWVLVNAGNLQGWVWREHVTWQLDVADLPVANILARYPTPGGPTYTPNANWVSAGLDGVIVRSRPGDGYVGDLLTGDVVAPHAILRTATEEWVLIRFGDGFGWVRRDLVRWQDQAAIDALPPPEDILGAVALSQTPPSTGTYPVRPSATYTLTPSDTPDVTDTPTPTATFTPSATPTATVTPSNTPTATPTLTPTVTPSFTPTPSLTLTWTPSATPTLTPSLTLTPTATSTLTLTLTFTPTVTSTVTPTVTVTATATATLPPATAVAAQAARSTPTPAPTATESPAPTGTPTRAPAHTATLTATIPPTATHTPTLTATDSPTVTRTMTPTVTPSGTPTATATPAAVAALDDPGDSSGGGSALAPLDEGDGADEGPPVWYWIGGGLALLAMAYVGVYAAQVASLGRPHDFVLIACPVCEVGDLYLEERRYRVLGIPRARRVMRCDNCRSVLRSVGRGRWRYAIDGAENPVLYDAYNNAILTEDDLLSIAGSPPPKYIEDDDTLYP
jgi:hypothetical protein